MRVFAMVSLGLGFALSASAVQAMPVLQSPPQAAPTLTKVEYFCGVGFVPTYGGQCVATMARDEVELFVNEPSEPMPVVHRHHRRHTLSERY